MVPLKFSLQAKLLIFVKVQLLVDTASLGHVILRLDLALLGTLKLTVVPIRI